jgi:AraC-like DNA-binding protein
MQMGSRKMLLMPGQVSLGDSGLRRARVIQSTAGAFHSVVLDRKLLLASFPSAEDFIARPVSFDGPALGLLRAYIDIIRNDPQRLNAATASAVGQHLLDLVVLVLGAGGDLARTAEAGGLAEARFESIKADILARLSSPDLSIATLAAGHRVSIRYVQYLFEHAGTSFTEFVLEQRLLLALRLLRNPLHAQRKIADMALLAGFSSMSYFHRSFRQRFGMTPAEARGEMKGEGR